MRAEFNPTIRTVEDLDRKPADFMTFPDDEPGQSIVKVKQQALSIPMEAKAIIVRDQPTLDQANDFLRDVRRLQGKIAESFDPQIDGAHRLHKSLLAEKKKFTEPLEMAEKIVRRTIAGYLEAEEMKRREAERERARIEQEARDVAEKALAAAAKHEENGKYNKAVNVIEDASAKAEKIMATAPEVPDAPKADGLSLRTVWKFEIIDVNAIPREYLMVDEKKLGRIVRAMGNDARIPGIRVFHEKTLAAREF